MKKQETLGRDRKVTKYLTELYGLAVNDEYEPENAEYIGLLSGIFDSKTTSYREIILVALVGRKLDNDYRAYSNFYGCKPRAIFEGPIKDFCLENGFPHTKSGPLNIAKASNINEAWSSQRDPQEDAVNVVSLIKLIDSGTNKFRKDVGVDLMKMYINIAIHVDQLSVEIEPTSDPRFLTGLCKAMINGAPDAGNTPQRIFGYLLEAYHESLDTGIIVSGTEDSASATSTTSKKPGDINEEGADGTIYKVYEVTVKKFDLSRINDSYDCVRIYNEEHDTAIKEIIVVCRKQDCIPSMNASGYSFCMGSYEHQDIIYYYWNIYEWIAYTLEHMIPSARSAFYGRLNEYINNPNTHEPVKLLWKQLHESS